MSHVPSDSELILELPGCSEERKAQVFLTLYDRYKNLVLKAGYHYLADYDRAVDILHDVFVKVLEKAETMQDPRVFRSWLMTITRNICVDYLRKTSYLKSQDPLTEQIEVTAGEDVEKKMIAEMDKQKMVTILCGCLERLDSYQLSIFKMRWKGLKAARIQKILKVDRGEVRRAYDGIKRSLEGCMARKGWKVSIDRILSLSEIDG